MTPRQAIIQNVITKINRWNALPQVEQVEIAGKTKTVIRCNIAGTEMIYHQVNEWQLGHGTPETEAYLSGLSEQGEVRLLNEIERGLK